MGQEERLGEQQFGRQEAVLLMIQFCLLVLSLMSLFLSTRWLLLLFIWAADFDDLNWFLFHKFHYAKKYGILLIHIFAFTSLCSLVFSVCKLGRLLALRRPMDTCPKWLDFVCLVLSIGTLSLCNTAEIEFKANWSEQFGVSDLWFLYWHPFLVPLSLVLYVIGFIALTSPAFDRLRLQDCREVSIELGVANGATDRDRERDGSEEETAPSDTSGWREGEAETEGGPGGEQRQPVLPLPSRQVETDASLSFLKGGPLFFLLCLLFDSFFVLVGLRHDSAVGLRVPVLIEACVFGLYSIGWYFLASWALGSGDISPSVQRSDFVLGPRPKVVGHRGAPTKRPENTLSSFSAAVASPGCWGLETDVHFSKDGVPFLLHDDTLRRTTDVGAVFPERVDDRAESFSFFGSDRSGESEDKGEEGSTSSKDGPATEEEEIGPASSSAEGTPRSGASGELGKLDAASWFLFSDPFGQLSNVSEGVRKEILSTQNKTLPSLESFLLFAREHPLIPSEPPSVDFLLPSQEAAGSDAAEAPSQSRRSRERRRRVNFNLRRGDGGEEGEAAEVSDIEDDTLQASQVNQTDTDTQKATLPVADQKKEESPLVLSTSDDQQENAADKDDTSPSVPASSPSSPRLPLDASIRPVIFDLERPPEGHFLHEGDRWLEAVLDVVNRTGTEKNVWWYHGDDAFRAKVREKFPRMRQAVQRTDNSSLGGVGRPFDVLNVPIPNLFEDGGTALRERRKEGFHVNVWVVNSHWLFSALWSAGVADSVTSNWCKEIGEAQGTPLLVGKASFLWTFWILASLSAFLYIFALIQRLGYYKT
uniref:GP-PDE domain-containing protein n=1 Tax=Chromera velia CCMP2878 TaxID=1169474 RepID=A0A0G4HRN6_9ALVE|eukprot:Cvel_8125.t1-p1 / transcript=Cvel_8125.t1 / gene=Cvel_8125 / organism=Chromera_velia_CCMP2878 / gene_product=Glycerophosphoinositol inositolphosphodiesterase, putative / transcript_product=Glycerophosphoinositol inositolphosphodiesterase, putative / location=Cvel_scaffold442:7671-13553(-) / protein_length=816 / sequence_SO=supercontig / SO=protein_coding / is_pseudo=false